MPLMPLHLVLMGPAGSGKTAIGARLARRIEGVDAALFIDADDLHPQANRDKMAAGRPLDDADRWPWLQTCAERLAASDHGVTILACSALKRSYRDVFRSVMGVGGGVPVQFVYLRVDAGELMRRLQRRAGHYFSASLLESQLQTLEEPAAEDELDVLTVDCSGGDKSVDDVIDEIMTVVPGLVVPWS